jgi:hypothetical protein
VSEEARLLPLEAKAFADVCSNTAFPDGGHRVLRGFVQGCRSFFGNSLYFSVH